MALVLATVAVRPRPLSASAVPWKFVDAPARKAPPLSERFTIRAAELLETDTPAPPRPKKGSVASPPIPTTSVTV
jgi:hypothetical protein